MRNDVVLDASAVVEMILGRSGLPGAVGSHSHAGLDIEVTAVLRRHVLRAELPAHAARESLDALRMLEIARHPLRRILPRIWALRQDISAYDAGYVALAEALGVPLITLDGKLAKTARRYCDVIVP